MLAADALPAVAAVVAPLDQAEDRGAHVARARLLPPRRERRLGARTADAPAAQLVGGQRAAVTLGPLLLLEAAEHGQVVRLVRVEHDRPVLLSSDRDEVVLALAQPLLRQPERLAAVVAEAHVARAVAARVVAVDRVLRVLRAVELGVRLVGRRRRAAVRAHNLLARDSAVRAAHVLLELVALHLLHLEVLLLLLLAPLLLQLLLLLHVVVVGELLLVVGVVVVARGLLRLVVLVVVEDAAVVAVVAALVGQLVAADLHARVGVGVVVQRLQVGGADAAVPTTICGGAQHLKDALAALGLDGEVDGQVSCVVAHVHGVRVGQDDLDDDVRGRALVHAHPVEHRHAVHVRALRQRARAAHRRQQRVPVAVDGVQELGVHRGYGASGSASRASGASGAASTDAGAGAGTGRRHAARGANAE